MSFERKCDLCLVYTPADQLERVEDVFPLGFLCPACAVEVLEDEAHPRESEPEHDCRSFCRVCAPGA